VTGGISVLRSIFPADFVFNPAPIHTSITVFVNHPTCIHGHANCGTHPFCAVCVECCSLERRVGRPAPVRTCTGHYQYQHPSRLGHNQLQVFRHVTSIADTPGLHTPTAPHTYSPILQRTEFAVPQQTQVLQTVAPPPFSQPTDAQHTQHTMTTVPASHQQPQQSNNVRPIPSQRPRESVYTTNGSIRQTQSLHAAPSAYPRQRQGPYFPDPTHPQRPRESRNTTHDPVQSTQGLHGVPSTQLQQTQRQSGLHTRNFVPIIPRPAIPQSEVNQTGSAEPSVAPSQRQRESPNATNGVRQIQSSHADLSAHAQQNQRLFGPVTAPSQRSQGQQGTTTSPKLSAPCARCSQFKHKCDLSQPECGPCRSDRLAKKCPGIEGPQKSACHACRKRKRRCNRVDHICGDCLGTSACFFSGVCKPSDGATTMVGEDDGARGNRGKETGQDDGVAAVSGASAPGTRRSARVLASKAAKKSA
jgi:hypothetical protein